MKSKFFIPTLCLAFLLAILIIPSALAAITIISPLSGTNHSGLNILFNVTYVNATDYYNAMNATFYVNISGSFTTTPQSATAATGLIGRSGSCGVSGAGGVTGACWMWANVSNLADGMYSINASLNNATAIVDPNFTATALKHDVLFDSTPPQIYAANITFPRDAHNYSYSDVFNITITIGDAILGKYNRSAVLVYFNFTNGSGIETNIINLTVQIKGDRVFNYSIANATTRFAEGRYNVTIWVNDSINVNNSVRLRDIVFDYQKSNVSYSCTPSSVSQGASTTCACTAADQFDPDPDMNSFTTSPSTSAVGTFSLSCIATDLAGNVGSGGGGGGAVASGWTTTYAHTDKDFSETKEVSRALGATHRVKVKLGGTTHSIGVTKVTSTTATVEVASTPQTATLNIGESKKFDVSGDGFYDIKVTLNSIAGTKADVTMSYVQEEIPAGELQASPDEAVAGVTGEGEEAGTASATSLTWLWWVLGIIAVVVVAYLIMRKMKK